MMDSFTEAIANASLFMSKDKTLPALCGVRVFADRALATDRYVMARQEFTADGLEFPPFTIPAAEIKGIVAKGRPSAVRVEGRQPGAKVTLDYADGTAITFLEVPAEFPSVERLFSDFAPSLSGGQVMFDPARLVPLSKLRVWTGTSSAPKRAKGAMMAATFAFNGPTKPVNVTVANLPEFRALIVPMKPADA